MDIPKILILIRPGAQWNLCGDTLEQLEWLDKDTEKPTLTELEAGQLLLENRAYRDLRASDYPPIGDQLDCIWKVLAQIDTKSPELQEMLKKIQVVKAKYPKPF